MLVLKGFSNDKDAVLNSSLFSNFYKSFAELMALPEVLI